MYEEKSGWAENAASIPEKQHARIDAQMYMLNERPR
jgi:hypothetical protein